MKKFSFFFNFQFSRKSFTFIDIIVGIFLMLIVFLGIFGAFQLGLKVISQSKAKVTATALANEKIEMARNLPYDQVGIVGGYPQGIIPATEIVTRNNGQYTVSTTVDYIADEADGLAAPEDICPNDYKRIRVTVSWAGRFPGEISLATDVAPKNEIQECEETGGILWAKVFDAKGQAVADAQVLVEDILTGLTKSCLTSLDQKCYILLPASPEAENYKVEVTKTGYSSEETFKTGDVYNSKVIATPEKPNVTIFEGQITEISLAIDKVSTFLVETRASRGKESFDDQFDNQDKISQSSNISLSDGQVRLAREEGVEFTGGTTDGDLCSFPGIDGDCGQSFTMEDETKEINQVSLYLKKATSDPSDIYLEIREGSTIGQVMASSTLMDSASLSETLSWTTFNLQNSVILEANTQYFLRLRSQPDSTDPWAGAEGYIYWGYIHSASSPPAYDGGDAWRYIGRNLNPDDPGQQLGPDDQYDFSFRIYEGNFLSPGYLLSIEINPSDLASWDQFSWQDSQPENTQIIYQVFFATDTDWFLIPDSDLPGNSTGLGPSPVDLSNLDVSKYSALKLKATLSTTNSEVTPSLSEWHLSYFTRTGQLIANVDFHLEGEKVVGLDGAEEPIYKYSKDLSSDSSGQIEISNLEWDNYTFSETETTGMILVETDPPQPISLDPETILPVTLYFEAENTLLLLVQDSETADPIFNASVRLYKADYDTTQFTDERGETYFIPLDEALYNLEVTATGYQSYTGQISVSGQTTKTINLTLSPS